MATPSELMGLGLPALVAKALGQSMSGTLTATGSTATDALAVTDGALYFGTVAASTGCILPNASGACITAINNGGASTLTVYPATGQTINGTTSFSVTNAKTGILVPSQNGWIALLSA